VTFSFERTSCQVSLDCIFFYIKNETPKKTISFAIDESHRFFCEKRVVFPKGRQTVDRSLLPQTGTKPKRQYKGDKFPMDRIGRDAPVELQARNKRKNRRPPGRKILPCKTVPKTGLEPALP
jgi:hypothetical protein